MDNQPELVTVFRSGDHSAEDDARSVCLLLEDSGLAPVLVDDKQPGVIAGTFEVRVPASQAAQAEQLLAAEPPEEEVDLSHGMDLVTIFRSEAASEIEAMGIKSILDANGIPAVVTGATAMPMLPVEVRVPRDMEEKALIAIAEAQAAGPGAAEEAEQASENPS